MIGAFQNDAFDGIGFQIDYQFVLNATENSDTASFTVPITTDVGFTITENPDVPTFTAEVIGYLSFDATESKDVVSINVKLDSRRLIEINVVENRDTAEVVLSARNLIDITAFENSDTVTFNIDARTQVYLAATENRDIASFRTFAAFFTDGDTDYIHLQPELREAIVPAQIDRAAVPYSPKASVPSENRQINVAQTQLQRKARE